MHQLPTRYVSQNVHSRWMISGTMQSKIGRHLEHVWRETRSSLGHDSKQC